MDIRLLESEIRLYDEKYRQGDPIVSDAEYDELVEKLRTVHPGSDIFKSGVIPTKISRKEKLSFEMASLDKIKSIDEFKKWAKSNDIESEYFVITPKFDGISLLVDEQKMACWTRGDGEIGQRSDKHFRTMNNGTVESAIRYTIGEAIMPKGKFTAYSHNYANPRNLVAGLFNRDECGVELADVDYVRYGLSKSTHLDKSEILLEMRRIFSNASEFKVLKGIDIDYFLLEDLYHLWSEKYQIDGLVIELDDADLRNKFGRESNGNPAYAKAYKNPAWSSGADVEVTGVTWQVSKQGKLKPVIQIQPTQVGGVTITNVTGYNAKYVFDNDIARGSVIRIVRSGDVIPKHIETISYSEVEVQNHADEVTVCPSCGQPTAWDYTMTELVCSNEDCEEKQIMKLLHFFNTMDVEDFGEPSIRAFYNAGFKTVESILNMKQIDIISIEGFGSKTSAKLLSQFGKIQNGVPLAKLMHALDLFDGAIGEKTAQKILDEAGGVYEINSLCSIEGVAEKTAAAFIQAFEKFDKIEKSSIHLSYVATPKVQVTNDTYKDIRVCFTGCRPNKQQLDELIYGGGEMVSGVSSKTTHLVVKDMSEKVLSSNKSQKANKLGIKIVPIKEFFV